MFQAHGRTVGITVTGGIDSVVLLYWLCENYDRISWLSPTPAVPGTKATIEVMLARFGQANFDLGWKLAARHIEKLAAMYKDRFEFKQGVVDIQMPNWSEQTPVGYSPKEADYTYHQKERSYEDCFIDGRNMILFAHLMSWCSKQKIPILLTGHQNEIHEWDGMDEWKHRSEDIGPNFLDRMNLCNECGFRNRVRIHAPFLDLRLNKYDIVKLGLDLGVDLGAETYSCIHLPACGKCDNCVIRRKAFAIHGVEDKSHEHAEGARSSQGGIRVPGDEGTPG